MGNDVLFAIYIGEENCVVPEKPASKCLYIYIYTRFGAVVATTASVASIVVRRRWFIYFFVAIYARVFLLNIEFCCFRPEYLLKHTHTTPISWSMYKIECYDVNRSRRLFFVILFGRFASPAYMMRNKLWADILWYRIFGWTNTFICTMFIWDRNGISWKSESRSFTLSNIFRQKSIFDLIRFLFLMKIISTKSSVFGLLGDGKLIDRLPN